MLRVGGKGAGRYNCRTRGPTTILPRPQVRFGTHNLGETNQPGLILLENLCYVRSWLRHVSEAESIPTGPRVTTTFFDGPRPVTVREPVDAETSPAVVNVTENNRSDHTDGGLDPVDTLTLPNGRRTTGQVVRPYADGISYEGTRVELDEEAPGVSIFIHVDGIGSATPQNRKTAPEFPDPTPLLTVCFNGASATFDYLSNYGVSDIAIYLGPGGGPESDAPRAVTAIHNAAGTGTEAITTGAFFPSDTGTCACRDLNASMPTTPAGTIEPATGSEFDYVAGNLTDTKTGVIYSGGQLIDDISSLIEGFDRPAMTSGTEGDSQGHRGVPAGSSAAASAAMNVAEARGECPGAALDKFYRDNPETTKGTPSGRGVASAQGFLAATLGFLVEDGATGLLFAAVHTALVLSGPLGWAAAAALDGYMAYKIAEEAVKGADALIEDDKRAQFVDALETTEGRARATASLVQIILAGRGGLGLWRAGKGVGRPGPAVQPKADAPGAEGPSSRQKNWADAVQEANERIAKQKADNPQWEGLKCQADPHPKGLGNITHKGRVDATIFLKAAQKWLGEGYTEIASGIFRSKDGTRQVRFVPNDLAGKHGDIGPHAHFESLNPRGRVTENNHVPLVGE